MEQIKETLDILAEQNLNQQIEISKIKLELKRLNINMLITIGAILSLLLIKIFFAL